MCLGWWEGPEGLSGVPSVLVLSSVTSGFSAYPFSVTFPPPGPFYESSFSRIIWTSYGMGPSTKGENLSLAPELAQLPSPAFYWPKKSTIWLRLKEWRRSFVPDERSDRELAPDMAFFVWVALSSLHSQEQDLHLVDVAICSHCPYNGFQKYQLIGSCKRTFHFL